MAALRRMQEEKQLNETFLNFDKTLLNASIHQNIDKQVNAALEMR
jgi:hypothetical protein